MKPTPGTFYLVISGDQIRKIARRAYGFDRSADVVDANSDLLKGKPISLEGLPTIYAGNRLWLPEVKKQFSETIPFDVDDEISIRIDGKVFSGWTASSMSRNINTIADSFTYKLPYNPFDLDLRERTRPYGFQRADLFIGGELYIAGQNIKVAPSMRATSTEKTIDARTKAGHTIECMAQKSSLEFTGQTLAQIATAIMKPYGDDLKPLFFDGDSDIFPKVRKEITDTDFDFLSGLAAQKGFMITSSDTGQMAFIRAAVNGKPVFRFIEGETAIEHMSASYDGQSVHSSLTAVTESAGAPGPSSSIDNPLVPIYRPLVFSADDLEAGNLDSALKWRRSKSLADSGKVSFTIAGWRNEFNQLWRENMIGTVLAPSIDIFTESSYIISGVHPTKSKGGGNIAQIDLVLPQAFTLDYPDSFPWEG